MSTIFVSIAAYRDPELVPTLRSCLETAANSDNLRFCVAWQRSVADQWDLLDEFAGDSRFQILDIDYRESRGVCWARHLIQKHFQDEAYYLQLDSHHRFSCGWDEKLKDTMETLRSKGYKKPVISGYLPQYNPKQEPNTRENAVYSLNIDRFLPEGVAFLVPSYVNNYEALGVPFPSRFISAHFIFAGGSFAREVPYDPHLYFHGEESAMAVRAFTHGYDIFSPHRPLIWHEYTRRGKVKHWDDCADWWVKNSQSYARYRRLFGMEDMPKEGCVLNEFGFGEIRTLSDYESFAGINFRERRIHRETLLGEFPPIKTDLASGMTNQIKVCIDVHKDSIPETDYDFFAVALLNKCGDDLFRQDCDEHEIRALIQHDLADRFIHIWRTFNHDERPPRSRVWPHSRSKGWMSCIEQVIPFA